MGSRESATIFHEEQERKREGSISGKKKRGKIEVLLKNTKQRVIFATPIRMVRRERGTSILSIRRSVI